jgi:hypothetical protein
MPVAIIWSSSIKRRKAHEPRMCRDVVEAVLPDRTEDRALGLVSL